MSLSLSLILATYGRTDELDRFFDSLVAQTDPAFEVIVVDQNPDDRLAPHVARARLAGLDIHHLRQDQPNLSSARNLGLACAQGDWVAFPDDDCWYEPDAISRLSACRTAHADWSGIVATWTELAAGPAHESTDSERKVLSLERWRRFRDGDASSITLFLARQLLTDIGGFDPRLGVGQWFGAGEETDLVLRALSVGAIVGRCADVRVHHHVPSVSDSTPKGRAAAMKRARGVGALYVKHRLPWDIILRGVVAPVLRALWPWRGRETLLLGCAVLMGRVQGAWAWRRRTR